MPSESLYLDSSALVKLVLLEPGTASLRAFVSRWRYCVSSSLAVVEVNRAVRRASTNEFAHRRAERVLEGIDVINIDSSVTLLASRLSPRQLRSLDAIHLASAMLMRPDLGAFVAYDVRLIEAAERHEFEVVSPR